MDQFASNDLSTILLVPPWNEIQQIRGYECGDLPYRAQSTADLLVKRRPRVQVWLATARILAIDLTRNSMLGTRDCQHTYLGSS